MAKSSLKISNTEMYKMLRDLRAFDKNLGDAMDNEVNKATLNLAADAKQNIQNNNGVATGQLINSIETRFNKAISQGEVEVMANYAGYYEFGRKAGGRPPIKFILEWVRKRHLSDDEKEQKQIAFAIAKSIEKNGTKPHPFFYPAFKKNARRLRVALRKILDNSGRYSNVK